VLLEIEQFLVLKRAAKLRDQFLHQKEEMRNVCKVWRAGTK
jgi:hypothetical protein